jgi:hypothetical protein
MGEEWGQTNPLPFFSPFFSMHACENSDLRVESVVQSLFILFQGWKQKLIVSLISRSLFFLAGR